MQPTILVVDDEKNTREGLARALRRDHNVLTAESAASALAILAANHVDLMLSDVRMPDTDGIALLKTVRAKHPDVVCILLTAYGSVETAVEAMKLGAADFITKPVNLDHLDLAVAKALKNKNLETENLELKRTIDRRFGLGAILGDSPVMERLFDLIRQVAPTQATVLIEGASGTGKELVARSIHSLSRRSEGPFIAVHCAALNPSLLESELFGHEKGSFTGASERRAGRFEAANRGTLFLDEISEIDPSTQVKLLRVLQEKRFERVGGTEEIEADIRIIAATNRDLRKYVDEGKFREDLYYRLDVVRVNMPPLRERGNDIISLTRHFIKEFSEENGRRISGISPDAAAALQAYAWPGNVRELRNTIERMVVLARGAELGIADVPENIKMKNAEIRKCGNAEMRKCGNAEMRKCGNAENSSATTGVANNPHPGNAGAGSGLSASPAIKDSNIRHLTSDIDKTLGEIADDKMIEAIHSAHGNITEAARILGVSRRTIQRKAIKNNAIREAAESATTRRRRKTID